jgi:hypothetical protein
VVGVGLVEATVRLFLPAFDPSGQFRFSHEAAPGVVLGAPDSVARQRKNTGDYDVTIRINGRGLRDDLDVATAGPGDLVVLGDSFAWGWGVEAADRFSDRLRGLTGRRVFNVATPTDLAGYRALLDHVEGLGARPGGLVLAICLENDLLSGAPPPDVPPGDEGIGLRAWLERSSAAYLLLTTAVHQVPLLRDLAVRLGMVTPNLRGISRSPDSDAAIVASVDAVAALARGRPMLVVIIPSRGLWAGEERAREDRLHRRFVVALQARGLDVLDLRPLLEAGGRPLSYHFASDGHWNAEGHRLAAEAIARRLRGG